MERSHPYRASSMSVHPATDSIPMKFEIADPDALPGAKSRDAVCNALHPSVTTVRAQMFPDALDLLLNVICCRFVGAVERIVALNETNEFLGKLLVFAAKAGLPRTLHLPLLVVA